MIPYYEDNLARIYKGNYEDVCEKLTDKVDLVLTDPPYGMTDCDWDIHLDLTKMWDILKSVSHKDTVYIFTAAQPFTSKLVMSNLKWFKCEWIWDKYIPRGFQTARYKPMNKHESVLVFCEERAKYYPQMVKRDKPVTGKNYSKKIASHRMITGEHPKKVYEYKSPDTIIQGFWEANHNKIHPNQKPVGLGKYLIKTYSDIGSLILDPFAGSHSFGVAAKTENRKSINIEQSEEYCEKGKLRLNKTLVDLHIQLEG